MPLVFVFGTERRGLHNHFRLGPASPLGLYQTAEPFCMITPTQAPFPYITRNRIHPYMSNIVGELYDVPEAAIQALDTFEGHPTLATRQMIKVQNPFGEKYAWVYIIVEMQVLKAIVAGLQTSVYTPVPHGDWAEWIALGSR